MTAQQQRSIYMKNIQLLIKHFCDFPVLLSHGRGWFAIILPRQQQARFQSKLAKETGRWEELWKLGDIEVTAVTELPATGKTEGLNVRQVQFYSRVAGCLHPATGPWAGHFSKGKKNFLNINNQPRTPSQKLVRTNYGFFQTLKENPNNKTSCISSPLLSSSLPGTKAYMNYFHTGKLFKAKLFPYSPLILMHRYFVKMGISTQTLFHNTTTHFCTNTLWKEDYLYILKK